MTRNKIIVIHKKKITKSLRTAAEAYGYSKKHMHMWWSVKSFNISCLVLTAFCTII